VIVRTLRQSWIDALAFVALVAALAQPAVAADESVLEDPQLLDDAPAAWILTADGEVDGDGGYLVDGSAAFAPSGRTTFTLRAGHSDTSTRTDEMTASTVGLDLDRSFDHWGLTLSGGYWQDPNLARTTEFGGSLFLKWAEWRLTALAEKRASNFDSFTVSGTIDRPNLPPVTVTGDASCDLDGSGYGARFSYTGERWSAYLSGKSYDYDNFNCRFQSLTIGRVHVPSQRLRTLNPLFLRLLTLRATVAGYINLREDTVFLDSSIAAGVSAIRAGRTYALDYSHTRELFDGLESNTLTASLAFALSRRTDLELRVGAFDSQGASTVGFAGVTLIAYFGG
jgi:hypothetical protein